MTDNKEASKDSMPGKQSLYSEEDGGMGKSVSEAQNDSNKRQLSLDELFTKKKKTVSGNSSSVCDKPKPAGARSLDTCTQQCSYCRLEENINPRWKGYLRSEFEKDYFKNIKSFLHKNRDHLPPINKIFTFTNFFPLEDTKVVIMGQDPYHNDNQAMGLSFSVPIGIPVPPSLKNIYLEMKSDIEGFEVPSHGDLSKWARCGVLLLNDVLTVTKNRPNSHADIGWREFTTKILQIINEKCKNVVFMLWGRHAQAKGQFINRSKHLVLACGHPSPFSAKNFFGCKHFSRANKYLIDHGKTPIKW